MSDDPNREQLLIWLVQECAEVQKAATKCLLHGYDRVQPGYGRNDSVLAEEVGDLLGVLDALDLERQYVTEHRQTKLGRMIATLRMVRENP